MQEKLTVHKIVLRNIADGSSSFTYVKSHIRMDDGRVDVKAIHNRYKNASMQEQYISDTKHILFTISYRN